MTSSNEIVIVKIVLNSAKTNNALNGCTLLGSTKIDSSSWMKNKETKATLKSEYFCKYSYF